MTDKDKIREEKDRAYGDPQEALPRIGQVWLAYLGQRWGLNWGDITLDGKDVANMYAMAKIMRVANPKCPNSMLENNYADTGIYIDIAQEIDERLTSEG